MRLAIRDDDTNFFTTPAELEACYGEIWHEMPPTLSLISKVKGNWLYWVHQIYKDRHETDWNAWKNDDVVYPIENNTNLVQFLRQKLNEGKLDLSFHAKHHRNEDDQLPAAMSNNYVRGAEFYTTRELTGYIKDEINHLEQIFNYHISVFTPPQNLLSPLGYKAVLKAGLNICGGGLPFYKKEINPAGLINIIRQLNFKLTNRHANYPYVLKYAHHTEIPYHYPLQPTTKLETLVRDFEMVRHYDGDFVLSTHYVEFNYPMVYDRGITMKDVLLRFLDHVARYDVKKVTLSEMLRT